jgi:hypothetical protein
MKINIYNCLFLTLILFSSCGEKDPNLHNIIWFDNSSEKTLYIIESQTNFKDSLIPAYNPILAGDACNCKSYPHTKDDQLKLRDTYEGRFKDPNIDLIRIFVFDSETINQYGWETIRNGYMILKRYDLTLEDLNKLYWTVKYDE